MMKTKADLRSFGLTVGGAFALFGVLAWVWRGHDRTGQSLLAIGLLLAAVGVVAPAMLAPVERAWMALAHAISKVTTPIFMGVVYFVVFTPAGILRRTIGGRVLEHEDSSGSVWKPVKASPSMERQF